MRTAGVICECNPIHSGHCALFEAARRAGAEAVVAVMSGGFVQRGEAAVLDPFSRAALLLKGGADLVVELPFPYAASGAEFFASAGIEILDRLGVDFVWFGSECGELSRLQRLAAAADDPSFVARYAATVRGSEGTASAFFSSLQEFCNDGEPCLSNDILGISYLRALRARRSAIQPFTVKREGSAYHAVQTSAEEPHPSATALRRLWLERGSGAILSYLPTGAEPILCAAERAGKAPASLANAERLILGAIRLTSPERLDRIAELSGGLGNRLWSVAQKSSTLEELIKRTETKKYPRARIQRGILFALTDVQRADLRAPIAYVRLLAASAAGRAFLAQVKRTSELPVVTRRTDLPDTPDALRQEERELRAHALYSLCAPRAQTADDFWRQGPTVL